MSIVPGKCSAQFATSDRSGTEFGGVVEWV
jgi:hypothetical protein